MAQNITLLGANYPDVPAVTLPITGGGTATFSDTRSVTYNLTGGATASVNPSEAVTGQGFSVKLKAPAGYELSNVSITMGGVDITSQVFTPDEQGGGGGGGTYVRTEILAQQTITPDSSQRRATLTGLTEGFNDGEYYIVTYDGVEWLTTCETLWTSNFCIGESQWFLGTGEYVFPFGVIWMSGTTATVAAANTSQHSIKIEKLEFVDDGVELGTKTITQNGTYNASSDSLDGFSSVTVNVSSGGGASNVVIGEFTTGSTAGSVESISIPYTGSGFPLACMVYIAGGAYNNTSTGNTTWYNSKQRYAVGQWTYHNAEQSSSCVKGVVTGVYKNSTSSATSYSRTSSMTLTVRTSSAPNQSATGCVNITQDNKLLRWLVASTSYGLLANTKYTYIMIFSS